MSVVFHTTLIGAGQGLFLALFAAEALARLGLIYAPLGHRFFVLGAALSVTLAVVGLLASFFQRKREVIALPAFIAVAAAYGASHHYGWDLTLPLGLLGVAAALALFYRTAMIFASIKAQQEWANPFTVPNFLLMGSASGFTLALALSALYAPRLVMLYALAAASLTGVALFTRLASLTHNEAIEPRLKSEGRRTIRLAFLLLGFIAPVLLILAGTKARSAPMLAAAFVVQYIGLALERWFFLAEGQHPQNPYWQRQS